MGGRGELLRLQELDSERDAALQRLAEIEATLEDWSRVEEARHRLAEAEADARRWQARQRDLELEMESLSEKAARSEKRLYGGKVQNPKELSDLQAEIESLKRRRRTLEDRLLEIMISREEAESEHDEAQSHLQVVESAWSAQEARLEAERANLERRIQEIERRRRSVTSRVDKEVLRDYERVREKKGGQAVAQMRGDVCAACGVTVPQSMEWKLREGELVHCDSCGRILVSTG